MWVISAGLGLVRGDDPGPESGYSATFAHQSQDFVGHPTRWWNLLTTWHTGFFNHARSIEGLYAGLEPDDILIVVSSGNYYSAICDDLAEITPQDNRALILAGTDSATRNVPANVSERAFTFDFSGSAETAPGNIAIQVVQQVIEEKQRCEAEGTRSV
jgi:hypothetical protein